MKDLVFTTILLKMYLLTGTTNMEGGKQGSEGLLGIRIFTWEPSALRKKQQEAAEAYDIAAIKFRGLNAVTNFEINRYDVKILFFEHALARTTEKFIEELELLVKNAESLAEDMVRASCHLQLSMMQKCKPTQEDASTPLMI